MQYYNIFVKQTENNTYILYEDTIKNNEIFIFVQKKIYEIFGFLIDVAVDPFFG